MGLGANHDLKIDYSMKAVAIRTNSKAFLPGLRKFILCCVIATRVIYMWRKSDTLRRKFENRRDDSRFGNSADQLQFAIECRTMKIHARVWDHRLLMGIGLRTPSREVRRFFKFIL